ncbi:NUDIX domain-containing protein [Bacillus sp. KH172YL63]|uniref:NUDIX domain-containing protein n=1 Tax=Bacillus sp. KH172YL63 TaxID=2709784 RepID=UPI0013E4648F|nr:NUDIX domain-containing protein [Bacillus sp. KH172YL63]BCB02560.1 DNA mismatch repair protein MutT [Bacillus sp. KH172YL63]
MGEVFGEKHSGCSYSVRKGVYAVILDKKKENVLTVQTGIQHHFLPGGGMEEGEGKEDCLRRELLEETGYRIELAGFIGNAMRYFITRKGEYQLSDGYFYRAALLEQIQEPVDADHRLKWIGVDEAEAKLFHEHHIWAVKKVKSAYS